MTSKGFSIGNVELENPFLLAPLAGITDKAMRSLCAKAGASLTYTEMVSGKGLWYGDRKTNKLLEIGEDEGRVAFQIFGSEPEIMEHAAKTLCSGIDDGTAPGRPMKNLCEPVLLDLNAGCPVPKIVKNGEGSALLKNPDLLHDVVEAMVKGARQAADIRAKQAAEPDGGFAEGPKPVTVKMRIGFAKDEFCAIECAKAVEAAGASAITVHGRTREQFYEGTADWSAIARVKKAVNIPVIGNGDVFSGADALRLMDETGCDGVMIARGAMGNPWIFTEAKSLWQLCGGNPSAVTDAIIAETQVRLSNAERIDMLLHHMDLVTEDKGEEIAVKEMRKHIAWYTKGMRGATAVRREVNSLIDAGKMKSLLSQLR